MGVGAGEGLLVGSRVGGDEGTRVGGSEGLLVGAIVIELGLFVGLRVGCGVGLGQISSSVAEQVEALALHAVAPQHAKGVTMLQVEHDEVSLRSAGSKPVQPAQVKLPVPAKAVSLEQRL
jgi:hypothetical protein